jgi:hypothetical protein
MRHPGPRQQEIWTQEVRPDALDEVGFRRELAEFVEFGAATVTTRTIAGTGEARREVDTYTNEFWTSAQRQAHSLHEVSYRACFKPQLPAFFIERLTMPGDVVYDPFMGRGTTPLEAALRGRVPCGNDVNPLSAMLLAPRLCPPEQPEVLDRLNEIDLRYQGEVPADLHAFYHPDTLRELCALRAWFVQREQAGSLDGVDAWIRMVAVNRLTGHSAGYFSVYTLPPNQATSVQAQRKINEKRKQAPEPRDVRAIIAKKSAALLKDLTHVERATMAPLRARSVLSTGPAHATPNIADGSVHLVVTSPPFLDVVQYATDNWLRCWFCGIDSAAVPITMARTVDAWQEAMRQVLVELHRVLRPGGYLAFEVGEVKKGTVRLEEAVIPAAVASGLEPVLVLINEQEFTKTANCWGIDNNAKGTNSNRIVLLRRSRTSKCG